MRTCLFILGVSVLHVHTVFPQDMRQRVAGMLYGTVIGDAAGGPIEFAGPKRSIWTSTDTMLSFEGIQALADSFRLIASTREAEPYGHWENNALPGTATDDTRIKMILFDALRNSQNPTKTDFLNAFLTFPERMPKKYNTLCDKWLKEFRPVVYWEMGVRVATPIYPPDRIWSGVPTLLGQMAFIPIAALKPYDPEWTYLKTWELDFFDTGFAKDIHAGVMAGLSRALQPDGTWKNMKATMKSTDPFDYNKVPWTKRRLTVWLDSAHKIVVRSEGRVNRLFTLLEEEMGAWQWWDAWYPLVVVMACAEIAQYEPLASMQLTLEFGHDTDSYAQLMGAFMGAIYGEEVFPEEMKRTVRKRLKEDYGEDIEDWINILGY